MNNSRVPASKDSDALLAWYDTNARALAWRVGPDQSRRGQYPDPYLVWLSEIMLQQTQVKTVHQYYLKFIRLWPTLEDLANAELEAVLKAWAGLGYYSRARNLKKCAEIVYHQYGGLFPTNPDELKKLPGIGEYTSAAISAIAYGRSVPVIDGNVERVMARMHAIATPIVQAKSQIRQLVAALVPEQHSGDFAQAMMDLGATICTPKNPTCSQCPWKIKCRARSENKQTDFPVKVPTKFKPTRRGAAFVAMKTRTSRVLDGEVFLRKRPESGMLAGMSEVPSTDWSSLKDGETGIEAAPFSAEWTDAGNIRHSFTHFHIEIKIYYCVLHERDNVTSRVNGWWVKRENVMEEALPSLMKKALKLVFRQIEDIQ